MAVYRRPNRARSTLLLAVLVAITLVTLDARGGGNGMLGSARGDVRDAFAPVQRATHSALEPIGNFLSGAVHYGSLREENERLRGEVSAMAAASVQAAATERESEQVLESEHLPFVGSIPTVGALIIDQGSSNFETSVTIDKGSANGLVSGQPVVAAGGFAGGTGGLVGTIGEVAAHTATVQLLTDPAFTVGVQLDARNVGYAQGVGIAGPLQVTVVTTSEPPPKMAKGQHLVTSGLDKFPPGIPLGTVASVTDDPGAVEPSLTLDPMVSLDGLRVVQVELWSPQTAP